MCVQSRFAVLTKLNRFNANRRRFPPTILYTRHDSFRRKVLWRGREGGIFRWESIHDNSDEKCLFVHGHVTCDSLFGFNETEKKLNNTKKYMLRVLLRLRLNKQICSPSNSGSNTFYWHGSSSSIINQRLILAVVCHSPLTVIIPVRGLYTVTVRCENYNRTNYTTISSRAVLFARRDIFYFQTFVSRCIYASDPRVLSARRVGLIRVARTPGVATGWEEGERPFN